MTRAFPKLPLWSFTLLLVLPPLAFSPSSAFGQAGKPEGLYYKSWGVVIAIDDYLVAPKLSWPKSDAKAMAEALRQLKFDEVVEIYDKDASFRQLKSILNDYLPRKVGRMDRVVFFFAGHTGSAQDMNAKELGYLVPWDAQIGNAAKSVTLDDLKAFARRVMSKHILFILDTGISGWEVTPPQQLSLEGRIAPEEETEKRAVQVLAAAGKGETIVLKDGRSVFMEALLQGLKGDADADKNGWLMGTELGAYLKRQVEQQTGGSQHPQFVRLDGDGDTILIEGKKEAFRARPEPKTQTEREAAAKAEYEQAFLLLQQQRSVYDALERLNQAIKYDPAYGDAYVLKSYVLLEMLPSLDEAQTAAELAIKYAPKNPDSFYTLGLVLQRKGKYAEAERALLDALKVNPNYTDVYYSLGELYADNIKDKQKALDAFRRHLELGGGEQKARSYLEKEGKLPAASPP